MLGSMKVVNIYEAKTHLSRLVNEALQGEEIVIARAGRQLVKLVVMEHSQPARRLGTAQGKIWMSPDFDAPLEDFADYQ